LWNGGWIRGRKLNKSNTLTLPYPVHFGSPSSDRFNAPDQRNTSAAPSTRSLAMTTTGYSSIKDDVPRLLAGKALVKPSVDFLSQRSIQRSCSAHIQHERPDNFEERRNGVLQGGTPCTQCSNTSPVRDCKQFRVFGAKCGTAAPNRSGPRLFRVHHGPKACRQSQLFRCQSHRRSMDCEVRDANGA
jgi:hypothetical protein